MHQVETVHQRGFIPVKSNHAGRQIVAAWVLNDQLLDPTQNPSLLEAERFADGNRNNVRVVLVESLQHFKALPYHKKRLTLILSAGRHYAHELRSLGWQVDCISAETYYQGLIQHRQKHAWRRLVWMEAAERPTARLQKELHDYLDETSIDILPNSQFYWPHTEFAKPTSKKIVMENFYRTMRKKFNLLMNADMSPIGGQWNYDAENRKSLPKSIKPPIPHKFEPDAVTREVIRDVETRFPDHIGSTANFDLPVDRAGTQAAFQDFLERRLSDFGAFEDAMSSRSGTLWHSVMSPLMNLGLIDALEMCKAAELHFKNGLAPLNSVEGFIRQIIGWREFMHWQYHRTPDLRSQNGWDHDIPVPQFFWDGQTDLKCLHTTITRLIETGYNHHIERLMLLCNFAMLVGLQPEAVANWFLTMYVDSHDWVVLPNVIGMGLNADQGQIATKPYIASASYINKMSDHCSGCAFNPKLRTGPQACPFNKLYWNFLIKHEKALRSNPRMGPNVLGLKHLSNDERQIVRQEALEFIESMIPYDSAPFQPDDSCDN